MSDLWLSPRTNLDCNAQKAKGHPNCTYLYLRFYLCCFVKEIRGKNAELKMLSWLFISWALDFLILPGHQKLNKCLRAHTKNCCCICLSTDFSKRPLRRLQIDYCWVLCCFESSILNYILFLEKSLSQMIYFYKNSAWETGIFKYSLFVNNWFIGRIWKLDTYTTSKLQSFPRLPAGESLLQNSGHDRFVMSSRWWMILELICPTLLPPTFLTYFGHKFKEFRYRILGIPLFSLLKNK